MMKLITEELLDTVTSQAKENSRLRMNYNFHASMDAPIHRLLNAWLCKLNCVMLYSHSISSVGERPAPRGGTTRPDECKITTI